MIDQERVREMTKLAAMQQQEGKKYEQMVKFYRGDYIIRQLLKGFLAGTLGFGLLAALWVVCNMDLFIEEINTLQFMTILSPLLSAYLIFIIIYLIFIDIYANVQYAKGQDSVRRYDRHLKRLCHMYEEQEERMVPNGMGESDDGVHRI